MSLTRRLTLLLAVASLLAGLAWAWWQQQNAFAARLQEEARLLAEGEDALNRLARDLRRYEEARAQIGKEAGFARHEKLAVAARLSPAELVRVNDLLRRAYTGDGFLLLRHFSLAWSGERELSLELAGQKVFVR